MTTHHERHTQEQPETDERRWRLTRRGIVGGLGVVGLSLAASRLPNHPLNALAQTATVEPEPDPDPDPEADPEAGEADQATPALAGGELTIYSGRSETLVGPLIERFTAETGIDTEVRYAGTSELAVTILEEGDASPADLFFAQDAGALGLLAAQGRFQQLPQAVLERVDPRFRSPDGLWVGTSGRARVLVYNTDELQAGDLPTSVRELTDPAWKGKIGWAPENASFQAFITAFRVLGGDDAVRAWLQGMLANEVVNFGDSNTAIVRAVGEGEIAAGLVNHYYLYAVKREEGEDFPIANHFFAAGDPGTLINVAGVGILAGAAHGEQALPFVAYLLSEEGQEYFAAETAEYPLIAGVPTAEGLEPLAEIESPDIDLGDLADLEGTIQLLTEVGVL